jgi:1-phosphofructokinase family hexose kinase
VIVAAGLSPAWQQVLVVEAFHAGAVNRAAKAFWCASGKVINVGVALHHLSGGQPASSLTVSTLGGSAYDEIDRELNALGVPRRWIRMQAPTRVCTTIVDEATGSSTELVENAGPLSDSELSEFEAAFAEAAAHAGVVILTGSLPAGAPPNYFRRLLRHVRGHAVLDIRGPELFAVLEARPFLVKPNREELGRTLGRLISNDEEMQQAIAELLRRGAQSVVVTSGSDAVWVAAEGEVFRMRPPTVARIINPIGCGDCLAAGIAWGLDQGLEVMLAVEEGLEAAAKNLGTLLPSDFDGRREQLSLR